MPIRTRDDMRRALMPPSTARAGDRRSEQQVYSDRMSRRMGGGRAAVVAGMTTPAGPAFGGDQQNFPRGRGRVGGGNAGAFVPPAPPLEAPSAPAPVALGQRNVAITTGDPGRAARLAMQQANLNRSAAPEWSWDANTQMRDAAAAAGEAAAAARAAQGGRGYLSGAGMPGAPSQAETLASGFDAAGAGSLALGGEVFKPDSVEALAAAALKSAGTGAATQAFDRVAAQSEAVPGAAEVFAPGNRELLARISTPASRPVSALPDSSNPASQAYWDRADIQAWAGANPELARRLQERTGFAPAAATTLEQASRQAISRPVEGSFATQQPARFDALPPDEGTLAEAVQAAQEQPVFDPPADQRARALDLNKGYLDSIKRTMWGG